MSLRRPSWLALRAAAAASLALGCGPESAPHYTWLTTIHAVAPSAGTDTGTSPVATDSGTPPAAPPCDLQHDLASPHLWEGDELRFSVWCADPRARAAGAMIDLLDAGRHRARLRPDGQVEWQTGGSDGGRHDLTFTVQIPGATGMPESRIVPIWVADNPDAPGALPPAPETYEEEWGLPVVHIQHDSPLTQDDQPATFTVRGRSVDGEIKIRGATSVAYPKNSFTLDFDSAELAVDEWGERSRGHMILTTTFDDNSHLRQKLSFALWAALAERAGERRLAPRSFHAVVYRNGVYEGLYLASDRIDDEHARHRDFGGDGDLYKAVDHSANYMLVQDGGTPKDDLAAGWEKKEGADEADLDGIRALTAWAGSATPESFATEAAAWVQRGSFRDWQLFAMVSFAEDSAGKNHYIYQDDETGQFSAVPWDFNASWGQSWKTTRRDPDQLRDHTLDNGIFALQEQSPDDCAALVARFEALRAPGEPFDPAWLLAQVAADELRIRPSAIRDEQRWGAAHRSFFRWAEERDEDDDWTDFDGELAYLRAWIPERLLWVDQWVAERCGG